MKTYEAPKGGRYFRDLETGRRIRADGAEAVGHFVSPKAEAGKPAAAPAGTDATPARKGEKTGKGN